MQPTELPGGAAAQVQVPQLNHRPFMSLAPWPAEFSLNGHMYTLPPASAADWMFTLLNDQSTVLDLFLPLLDPDDEDRFIADFIEAGDGLEDTFYDLLELVSGRDWWVALKLLGIARGSWQVVVAGMMAQGVRADQLSLAAWLDVFTLALARSIKPEEFTMLMLQLEIPPEGEEVAEESMEISASQFLSMA